MAISCPYVENTRGREWEIISLYCDFDDPVVFLCCTEISLLERVKCIRTLVLLSFRGQFVELLLGIYRVFNRTHFLANTKRCKGNGEGWIQMGTRDMTC